MVKRKLGTAVECLDAKPELVSAHAAAATMLRSAVIGKTVGLELKTTSYSPTHLYTVKVVE